MGRTIAMPYAFDFYPLEGEESTRLHRFFEHLREGRLTTTRCGNCGEVLWQPRVVCPHCNHDEMEWIDLPTEGTVYAHTAVELGAPLGMEDEVPFVVALIELDNGLRLTARIDGAAYDELSIGSRVGLKVVELDDGRVWFRFVPVTGANE
jgi:uncharacterized OB-fold protein